MYRAADCIQQDEKIALSKVSNHAHEPEHTHNFVELVYILHGTGTHRINDHSYNVRRGDLIWMNVGDRHSFDGPDMQYMNILIQSDFLNAQLPSLEPDRSFFGHRLFHELLPKLLSYIERHYASPITLQDLAKESYYSPQYISKTFKVCCGYTFTEYVQEVRLREAKRMLLESADCVAAIGKRVGYPDKSQFFRLFKQYYGLTPQQLRDQASKS